MQQRTPWLIVAAVGTTVLLLISGLEPYDRATWLLEVLPVVIGLPVLWLTYDRFPLTTLLYACLVVHAVVLMVGGAYTYARVPLGFELQELLHLHRNPYDKIGHFLQGFTAALVARGDLRPRTVRQNAAACWRSWWCAWRWPSAQRIEFVEWGVALAVGSRG